MKISMCGTLEYMSPEVIIIYFYPYYKVVLLSVILSYVRTFAPLFKNRFRGLLSTFLLKNCVKFPEIWILDQ